MAEKLILPPETTISTIVAGAEVPALVFGPTGLITMPQREVYASCADDAVLTIALGGDVFAGAALIHANSAGVGAGLVFFRSASTASFVRVVTSINSFFALGDGVVPTGTTGTDGRVNIGAVDGNLYIENRSGNTWFFNTTIFGRPFP